MIEYIIIVILVVIAVLAYLIYQKVNTKGDDTVLTNIDTKLQTIVEAKKTMENLQGDMVDFKNLFNNRSDRGKFGEEYLEDLVRDALNKKHYKFQHTLSNGKRPDCFLTFGSPEESVCIDSKFSWENYKKMHEEKNPEIRKSHAKAFKEDIMQHIKVVADKYVINGETAPLALMFVAAEEVFRDISKHPYNFIKKAREKNVVIVSPDTIFGFLRTYRLLIQNREMYILSGIIQKEVFALDEDIGRLEKRITDADTKHSQISESFRQSRISVEKIRKHISKILNLDLDQKTLDNINQDNNPDKLN